MWFKLTPEKLRARLLTASLLELEQRTIQIEELVADRDMLVARVERLQAQVEEDALNAKKRLNLKMAGVGPGGQVPPRRPPKLYREGGIVPRDDGADNRSPDPWPAMRTD